MEFLVCDDYSLKKVDVDVAEIAHPQEFLDKLSQAYPHAILGLPNNANLNAVKSAFMKMSLKFHPDKWPEQIDNAVAVEAYKIIVSARDAIFDQKLSEALERKVSADIVFTDIRETNGEPLPANVRYQVMPS